MVKVYMCTGRYASTPYTIKKTCVRVYCVEELCFYIRQNAYFIDEDFFDSDMLLWFEEECDMASLSRRLKTKMRQQGRLEDMVGIILEMAHYCSDKEIEETKALLKSNRSMSLASRLKIRGDFFLKNEKYSLAIGAYEDLINAVSRDRDKSVLASAYHNLGVVYARLFMYSNAGKNFMKAYELVQKETYLADYLATLRFTLSEDAYLKKIVTIDGAYAASGQLEERINEISESYKQSDYYMKVKAIKALKEEGNNSEFDNMAAGQIALFKNEYRESMQS